LYLKQYINDARSHERHIKKKERQTVYCPWNTYERASYTSRLLLFYYIKILKSPYESVW